jgi:hypothetical protein
MMLRGITTALGAGLAWSFARVSGTRRRAGTVGLASVVGTQLAQTLTSGSVDRNVLAAALGSAAVLVGIIQTPGVSRFFGCTPLGPVAWGITLGSIITATLLHTTLPPLAQLLANTGWTSSSTGEEPDDTAGSTTTLEALLAPLEQFLRSIHIMDGPQPAEKPRT